jgi:hypothetical protein
MDSYGKEGVASSTDAVAAEQPRRKTALSAKWGVIACGAGLFADGYLNAVCTYSAHHRWIADELF